MKTRARTNFQRFAPLMGMVAACLLLGSSRLHAEGNLQATNLNDATALRVFTAQAASEKARQNWEKVDQDSEATEQDKKEAKTAYALAELDHQAALKANRDAQAYQAAVQGQDSQGSEGSSKGSSAKQAALQSAAAQQSQSSQSQQSQGSSSESKDDSKKTEESKTEEPKTVSTGPALKDTSGLLPPLDEKTQNLIKESNDKLRGIASSDSQNDQSSAPSSRLTTLDNDYKKLIAETDAFAQTYAKASADAAAQQAAEKEEKTKAEAEATAKAAVPATMDQAIAEELKKSPLKALGKPGEAKAASTSISGRGATTVAGDTHLSKRLLNAAKDSSADSSKE